MIKALIIDDEQHCISRLQQLLQRNHVSEIELLGNCATVKDGLKAINQWQPNLIFLDVQIHDRTGFELLSEAAPVNFKVIFTTAYDKFAIQAIRHSAIGYLLKPIDEDDLAEAVQKLQDISTHETKAMSELINHNLNPKNKRKRITIPSGNELVFIDIDDIVRCHSDINYTTIILKNGHKIVVAKTLKEFEEILNHYSFYRIHNSDLINIAYIKSYKKGKGGSVLLTDGTELEVSTRRKEDFLKIMSHF